MKEFHDPDPNKAMITTIEGKEIIIQELTGMNARDIDAEVSREFLQIFKEIQGWYKTTYEFFFSRPELLVILLATSTGQTEEYIYKLSSKHYDHLVFCFLAVNAEFFILRAKLINGR